MDSVERRFRNRSMRPSIEGMEGRALMSTALPDIAMVSAGTADSKSVTFDYKVSGADVAQPIHFGIYRSASTTLGADATPIGGIDVPPSAATAQGSHELTAALPGGLPPDPAQPYVLVVADPQSAVAETSKTNNTADFRTYVIAVITHGGLQPKSWTRTGPPWEVGMARTLLDEGYDAVLPVNWVGVSSHPGAAAEVAPKVESMIVSMASQFPANAPVDLHFIGHSEGAVVNSQALLRLDNDGMPANLKAGYIRMTMLDPHAANNAVKGPQYSVGEGPLGFIAKMEINDYQSKAHDPLVVVPSNVQDAEVFYQHTPVRIAGTNHGIYNLWGQVPVQGQASYFDLTARGVSHAGNYSVYDWYRINVVPSLATGGTFVKSDTLTGSQVTTADPTVSPSGRRQSVTYAGTAAPGAAVRLLAGRSGTKVLKRIGVTRADTNGSWEITSRPIAPGTYRVDAIATALQGPRNRPVTMRPTVFIGRVTIKKAANAPNIPA